jgi:hypothetical protein
MFLKVVTAPQGAVRSSLQDGHKLGSFLTMKAKLHIGPLLGGGLVTGYRCNSRCRHCLYACGPHRKDGAPEDPAKLEGILDQLVEKAPHARFHIGGGEPFLDTGLLQQAVEGLADRGLALEYVETNGFWAATPSRAEETLCELQKAGLDCILVSLSPFHAEFVAPQRTQNAIRAANRVLRNGAFVWLPEFRQDLDDFPPEKPISFSKLLQKNRAGYALELTARYGLVLGGRAGRFAAHHFKAVSWSKLNNATLCQRRLADTSHFHVDCNGDYVPGLCAGLVLPLDKLPGTLDLAPYPVLEALVAGGAVGLAQFAAQYGFEPLDRYASQCDLCTHARTHLRTRAFAELGPEGFYDPKSVGSFAQ